MFVVTKFTDDPEGPIYQLPKESVGDVDAIVRYFVSSFILFFLPIYQLRKESVGDVDALSGIFLLFLYLFSPIYQLP